MYLPYGSPSYKSAFVPLGHALAARGHKVTMITAVPTEKNAVSIYVRTVGRKLTSFLPSIFPPSIKKKLLACVTYFFARLSPRALHVAIFLFVASYFRSWVSFFNMLR